MLTFQAANYWKFISALKEKLGTNKFYYTGTIDEEMGNKRYYIL